MNIIAQPLQMSRSNSKNQSTAAVPEAIFAEGSLLNREHSKPNKQDNAPASTSASALLPLTSMPNELFPNMAKGREGDRADIDESQRHQHEAGRKAKFEVRPLLDSDDKVQQARRQRSINA